MESIKKKFYFKIILLFGLVYLNSCVNIPTIPDNKNLDNKNSAFYKSSQDASILLELQSNIGGTTFYIDGKKIATGRRVKVLINNSEHIVRAEPQEYISKEEFIQPPYMENSILSFTFLLGEKKTSETEENIIDVNISGIDDGVKTTRQNDYKEAVLFAKREAIERAGVEIISTTSVKDLMLRADYIEAKSKAVLQPGYQIIDNGYDENGTYRIVLIGKIKVLK